MDIALKDLSRGYGIKKFFMGYGIKKFIGE